jgi:serine/threonine protein kinase
MSTDAFLDEAQVMKSLDHKNIVKLLAVCTKEEPIYIVTEFVERGSLLEFLRGDEGSKTPESQLVDIAATVRLRMPSYFL